jgi:hypothetical protein
MKRISDKQINKYKSPLIFAATFVAIGLATLAFSSAATNSASIETESSAIAAPACTVNDVAASNGKALKFGGTGCAQIGNPLNIPTDPWWPGGNNYYKQFPAADAYGWSDPNFFPVVAFATNGDHLEHLDNMNNINVNTVLTGAIDHNLLKQFHISALSENFSPSAADSDVVGYVLDDEADGKYDAGWDSVNIDYSGGTDFSCGPHDPSRGQYTGCAYTETVFLNSLKNGTGITTLPPFSNSLATGGGRFRYNGYTGGIISREDKYGPLLNSPLPASLQVNSSTTVNVHPSYVGKKYQDFVGADRYWYEFADTLCSSPYTMQTHYQPPIITTHCPRASAYGRNVDNMRALDSRDGSFQPVTSDIELGCNESGGTPCISLGGISGAMWSNLIHGGMSAFYFPVYSFQCSGTTWTGGFNAIASCGPTTTMGTLLKNLNGQIKTLAPVLNSPSLMYNTYQNADDGNTATIDKSDYLNYGYVESKFNKNLDTMLKYYNGSYYLFAMINVNADPGAFNFTLPAGLTASNIQVLYDNDAMPGTASGRTIPVSNGTFTDSFAHEYTSHIYKITP